MPGALALPVLAIALVGMEAGKGGVRCAVCGVWR